MKIEEYLKGKPIIKVNKGKTLFLENESCNNVTFIVNGKIKISSFLLDGNEIVYQILKENDFFGNNLIMLNDNHYKGNVVAIEDSNIINVNKEELLTLLLDNKDFLSYYLSVNASNSNTLTKKLKLSLLNSPKERLEYLLKINNGRIHFSSISSLSNDLFIRRETTSRLINKLIKEKKIEIVDHYLYLLNQF